MVKKVIAIVLVVGMLMTSMFQLGLAAPNQTDVRFADVKASWAADQIARWTGKGLINGYSDGTFKPDNNVTRAEFCALVNRVFGFAEKSDVNFEDIDAASWYADTASIAKAAGYTKGWVDDTFSPDTPITRQEASMALYNAFKLTEANTDEILAKFKDAESVSQNVKDEIAAVIGAGLMNGYPDKTLKLANNITRAEAVTILDRATGELYNAAGTYTEAEITGNVVINTADVTLENTKIDGSLYLTEGIGQGDVTLNNVTVKGKTFVNGGGANSIHLNNTELSYVQVDKKDGNVRIVATGSSTVTNVVLQSGAKIEASQTTGVAFTNVTVASDVRENQQVQVAADVENLVANAQGASIKVLDGTISKIETGENASNTTISIEKGVVKDLEIKAAAKLEVNADAQIASLSVSEAAKGTEVSSQGKITQANVYADNVKVNDSVVDKDKKIAVDGAKVEDKGKADPPKKDDQPAATPVPVQTPIPPSATPAPAQSSNPPTPTPAKTNYSTPSPWTLTFDDEFNGTSIDSTKWGYDIGGGGWGNNELETYTNLPKNVNESGGYLNINAIKDTGDASYPYSSTRILTKDLYSQKYGKIEVRAKVPGGKGLWPAIWMMPQDSTYGVWAASGEIDIMEGWGSDTSKMCGTIHYGETSPGNKRTGETYYYPDSGSSTDFHVYSLEWKPGEVKWFVDGVCYSTQNNWFSKSNNAAANYTFPAPFDQNFYLIMNLAVGGNFDGNPAANAAYFPAQMQVDYVRMYEPTDGRNDIVAQKPSGLTEPLPEGYKVQNDGNLIYNNDYANGFIDEANSLSVPTDTQTAISNGKWLYLHLATDAGTGSQGFGGTGSVTTETISNEPFAKATITNGGNQNYAVQLIKTATIAKGRTYKVTFDAKSSAGTTISSKVSGDAQASWATYSNNDSFNITTSVQPYQYIFTMEQNSDLKARLEFELGLQTATVWIGNVRIEEIEPPKLDEDASKNPLGDGNGVFNGTFDQGDNANALRMIFWHFLSNGGSTATVDEPSRALVAKVTQADASAKLVQKGIQLSKGNEYTVAFKAKASTARTINVELLSKDGSTSYTGVKSLALTTSMADQSFKFTMTDATDLEAQLVFELGGNAADITIDNVSVTRNIPKLNYSGTEIIPDGSFDGNSLGAWTIWTGDQYSGTSDSTLSATQNMMKVHIKTVGNTTYAPQVVRNGLTLNNGSTYAVSFKAMASVARKMTVDVGKDVNGDPYYIAYAPQQTFDVGTGMTTYTYTFKVSKNTDTSLKIAFGLGKFSDAEPVPVNVFIDDVSIVEVSSDSVVAPDAVIKGEDVIGDGNLDAQGNWSSWVGDGAAGTVNFADGQGVAQITNIGAHDYAVQFDRNNVQLVKGETYTAVFRAKADAARDMELVMVDPGQGYLAFITPQIFNLTTAMTTYSYTFTVGNSTSESVNFEFNLGNVSANSIATKVYIDDIRLIKQGGIVTSEASGDEAYVAAKCFNSCITVGGQIDYVVFDPDANMSSTAKDTVTVHITSDSDATGYNATFTETGNDTGYFESGNITVVGASPAGANQIYANLNDVVTVAYTDSYGKGQTTDLTVVGQQVATPTSTEVSGQVPSGTVIHLSTVTAGATINISVNGGDFAQYDDSKGILINAATQIDAVAINNGKQDSDTATFNYTPAAHPLLNGTFDTDTEYWSIWDKPGESSTTMSVNGGKLKLSVPDPGYEGWETWATQVYQDSLSLENGKTYTLTFTASTTADRDIWVDVEDGNNNAVKYLPAQTVTLVAANGDKTSSFDFKMTTDASNGKLIFMLGNGEVEDTSFAGQSMYISNVSIAEKSN